MSILVVVEQREGKLNRVSMETLTAAQALAAETGWPLEAAVVGSNVAAIAANTGDKPGSSATTAPVGFSPQLSRQPKSPLPQNNRGEVLFSRVISTRLF